MTRVLVAGGTGFLGGAIVRKLAEDGTAVSILTRNPENAAPPTVQLTHRAGPIALRAGDVTKPASLSKAMEGVDTAVFSVQFQGYPVEDPRRGRTFMDVDALGTSHFVDAAVDAGVQKVVYVSGVGADPAAERIWYRAKGYAEASVRACGLRWVILRPSWVYGPGDRSLNRLLAVIRHMPLVFPQLGSGSGRITPVFVPDFARVARDTILGSRADGRILEIGGPEVLNLDEIVRIAMGVLGVRRRIVHIPLPLVKLASAVLELLPGQAFSRAAVDFATQDGVADLTRTSTLFPEFDPHPLEAGLRKYAQT